MSDNETTAGNGGESKAPEPVPAMQRLLDNPFILLFLGIAVPALLYIVWGVIEVASVPLAD